MVRERIGGHFVVFIYSGSGPNPSWAVDSWLMTNSDLPGVFRWLAENIATDCCWSLGIVTHPIDPSRDSGVDVSWIVGGETFDIEIAEALAAVAARGIEHCGRRSTSTGGGAHHRP
jgi:hypothetical protein